MKNILLTLIGIRWKYQINISMSSYQLGVAKESKLNLLFSNPTNHIMKNFILGDTPS